MKSAFLILLPTTAFCAVAIPALAVDYREIPGTGVTVEFKASNNIWTDAEIVAAVHGMNVEYLKGCAKDFKLSLHQTAQLRDLNHDGIDELVVSSSATDPQGGGALACYGTVGSETSVLVSDNRGGWSQHFSQIQSGGIFAFDTTYTKFPLLQLAGPGFCQDLWQWDDGKSQWFMKDSCNGKVDDNGSLVKTYATGAHAVTPRTLSAEEIKAQLVKSTPYERPMNDTPTFAVDRPLSDMRGNATFDGNDVVIADLEGMVWASKPSKAMKASGIKRGQVLFLADAPWWNSDPYSYVSGVAYSFRRGCTPAGYRVSGGYDIQGDLVLKGAAPVWPAKGCDIRSNSSTAPGSVLTFGTYGDE